MPQFYSLRCAYAPECDYHAMGNSKMMLEESYLDHYIENHFKEPYITKIPKLKTKDKPNYAKDGLEGMY
jgi:predicted small metal-binding protein